MKLNIKTTILVVILFLAVVFFISSPAQARRVRDSSFCQFVKSKALSLLVALNDTMDNLYQILQDGSDILETEGRDAFDEKIKPQLLAAIETFKSDCDNIKTFRRNFDSKREDTDTIFLALGAFWHDGIANGGLWPDVDELGKVLEENGSTAELIKLFKKARKGIWGARIYLESDMDAIDRGIFMQHIDVNRTISEMVDSFKDKIEEKELKLSLVLTPESIMLYADKSLFETVISNLLQNAVKYTNSGSITIRTLLSGEGDNKKLLIEVKDTGIGIPEDEIGRVLDGHRGSNVESIPGTGAGLKFVKTIVDQLSFGNSLDYYAGSRIDIKSKVNEGTTVTIEIPYRNNE